MSTRDCLPFTMLFFACDRAELQDARNQLLQNEITRLQDRIVDLESEASTCHTSQVLAVRDRERNADESGSSTIHQGATAYFVFPADTGADASWLMGKEFAAKSELRFEDAKTGSFILRPHVHRKTSD